MADVDALRARFPHLGFAVYAYEPGGPVTLEVLTAQGEVFSLTRPTLAACAAELFPEPVAQTPLPPDPFG